MSHHSTITPLFHECVFTSIIAFQIEVLIVKGTGSPKIEI